MAATTSLSPGVAAAPPKSSSASKWIWIIAAFVIGGGIALLPEPAGLSHMAKLVLAITAGTAILWASNVINQGVASVLLMGFLLLVGVKPPLALSGYSDPAYWTLVAVLFYGFAMRKTGLAERVSYYILTLFPGSYSGILSAFFVIGFLLALGIPSMTVRTAIMVPIAWALCQSLGLKPKSNGAALIILTTVEMAVVPGLAFLLGSLAGPVVVKSFAAKNIPLTWGSYAEFTTVPTLILCALILFGNQWILKPEAPIDAPRSFARDRLKALGHFHMQEGVTGLVVLFSIVYWATASYHHLPSFMIGMFGLFIFAAAGIVTDKDIPTAVSWSLLLFLGGIFGLANVIQEYKVTDWVAGYLVPVAQGISGSLILVVIVLAFAEYVLRFLDPSSFIAIAVLFLSVVEVLAKSGVPPLVTSTAILLASVPFWAQYQNFWIAMGSGLTDGQGFDNAQMQRAATAYSVFALIALILSVGYWKLIGVV